MNFITQVVLGGGAASGLFGTSDSESLLDYEKKVEFNSGERENVKNPAPFHATSGFCHLIKAHFYRYQKIQKKSN